MLHLNERLAGSGESFAVSDPDVAQGDKDRVVDVAALRTAACARIDAKAEVFRAAVLTPGSGQAVEYYLTHAEALNYQAVIIAGKVPVEGNYPFLLAEQAALMATTGEVSLVDVVTAILADVASSKAALAAIKQARRSGKLAVKAATDVAGVEAAEAMVWSKISGSPR